MREKLLGESRFTLEQAEHDCLFDTNDGAGLKCARGGNAKQLCDTLKGFKERNGGRLPNPDSEAGRALYSLETFTGELHKLDIDKILGHKV